MKKLFSLSLFVLFFSFLAKAQDYKVTSVDYLQGDMSARKTIFTEKLDGGQPCAVLRISTQNILEKDRDAFQFECDMGSVIRERQKDGGEICLWVSPGIKILKIKHRLLGNYILNIPEALGSSVQKLNTYQINIVGLKDLPTEPLAIGSCQVVFRPIPENAVLYINGDSIGPGIQSIRSLAGTYHWSLEHPFYHKKFGTVELEKGHFDTLDIMLHPSYGYLKITDDFGLDEEIKVYLNGNFVGKVPFESGRLASGNYEVMMERNDLLLASNTIEIKDCHVTTEGLKDFITGGEKIEIEPIVEKIKINSSPDNATIIIDSIVVGTTPLTIDNLIIGPHFLKLTKGGCSPHVQEIHLEKDKALNLSITLQKGCSVTISSDAEGDEVFVDGKYIGETPVTTEQAFGYHSFSVQRDKHLLEKSCVLMPTDKTKTISFSFGQLVKVNTEEKRSKIYVDDKYIGRTPVSVYLTNGLHTLKATIGWKIGEEHINIEEDKALEQVLLKTHFQSPKGYVSKGFFFLTGNMAMVTKSNPVFGFCIGDTREAGWFVSLIASKNFSSYKSYQSDFYADENGNIDNILPLYSGEKNALRASATIGAIMKIAGPVYLRFGVGGGMRQYAWKTRDTDKWVTIQPYSWKNLETSLGFQCCIYNFVIHADALIPLDVLTEGKKLFEIRVGLGLCLKHNR
ncbi:MAG: PEGA domain-containing protein [Candidatus Limimorpha sp.]|uniref:PEGA domain-containing protein n=1 Tax=Prevotella heparinolytica TaxID=28113 RepID=UPI00359F8AB6